MILSQYEKENILSEFPNIKLSYENIIYKKVYNADTYVAIPSGIKCFAWFTFYNERNVCFIMELSEKKQIKEIKIVNTCFSSALSYGTILYGTVMYCCSSNNLSNKFFSVEDVFQYKGKMIERENWGNKYVLMKELFDKDIKQVAYNNSFIVFGLPLIANNIDALTKKIENVNYKIDTIQFRSFYRSNNYLFMSYKSFIETKDVNQNTSYNVPKVVFEKLEHKELAHKELTHKDLTHKELAHKELKQKEETKEALVKNEHPNKLQLKDPKLQKKEIVFLVRPDIQNDIYHLYSIINGGKEEYYGIACIPDYKCSVMMNQLFRNIKENQNLDALEESDDEEEFQNDRDDRFVHLDRSYRMICQFNYKFKKWFPVKVAV